MRFSKRRLLQGGAAFLKTQIRDMPLIHDAQQLTPYQFIPAALCIDLQQHRMA